MVEIGIPEDELDRQAGQGEIRGNYAGQSGCLGHNVAWQSGRMTVDKGCRQWRNSRSRSISNRDLARSPRHFDDQRAVPEMLIEYGRRDSAIQSITGHYEDALEFR